MRLPWYRYTYITMSLSLPDLSTRPCSAEVFIRPMQMEDLEAVHAIDCLSFSLPWPAKAFRYELLENERSRLWVAVVKTAEGNVQVVGDIVVWLVVDEAHIATLAVHPDYRRCGIARQLLATALEAARQMGMQSATLEVRAGNLAAQKLYLSFGFEIVGRRHAYYQDNQEDALIMTLADLGRENRPTPA